MLTQARLKELLHYNPDTGIFTRLIGTKHNALPGTIAGSMDTKGYCIIKIGKKSQKAHRLAWLYAFGYLPDGDMDHANGDRADNRISNLRLATRAQNNVNIKKPCTNNSGFKGVHFRKDSNKWRAAISFNHKRINLGSFNTPEEAHTAYCAAADKYHKEFANHG